MLTSGQVVPRALRERGGLGADPGVPRAAVVAGRGWGRQDAGGWA